MKFAQSTHNYKHFDEHVYFTDGNPDHILFFKTCQ